MQFDYSLSVPFVPGKRRQELLAGIVDRPAINQEITKRQRRQPLRTTGSGRLELTRHTRFLSCDVLQPPNSPQLSNFDPPAWTVTTKDTSERVEVRCC